jgi:hypothetical protein
MLDFDALTLAPAMAAFGEPAVYRPGAGAPWSFSGIFNRYASDDKITGDGEMRQVVAPTLGLRIADLQPGAPLPCRGETIVVRGIVWSIVEPIEDGFGHLQLKLRQVQ